MAFIRVGPDDIDMATEIACLQSEPGEIGGIASFLGVVRGGEGHSAITAMTLEHYPAMTEAAIRRVAEEAEARWNLIGCRVIHRVGRIPVGGRIVLVLTAARHRQAALESTSFLIDWLKVGAPFWKQEHLISGKDHWVEAKSADDLAAQRWLVVAPPD
ncbi:MULTISPECIES: molybdenum cofactor biosynthesis protein MoaE [unclassified Acidisoma]|uniref:molybdenum cofactor biosynthesis protein MoaE n=1 Tax=unclassified Acidisoma TaxID=2634065 RepID=UPI0020B1440F|nr:MULTISPECIES: molybdenum cofactor biosynthesis protein MoaE [unclassified Acidisoma]